MQWFLDVARRLSASLFIASVCALGLAACSTTGNSFDSSGLRYLVPGQTTFDEAIGLLQSAPTDIYRQQGGSATARWAHKASMVTDAIYFNQELWLTFGPDGRFQRIVKSENIPRVNMFQGGVRVDSAAVSYPLQP
jgi:hypothetical protein